MEIEITDGTGSGGRVKVVKNRLQVDAVTMSKIAKESIDNGNSYIIASDFVSLTTTGSFSGLIYIKGTDADVRFHIDRIRICGNGSAGANIQVKLLAAPTAGTLISDATAANVTNTNLGSTNTITGQFDIYIASGDGKTVTDGSLMSQYQQPLLGHSNQEYSGSIVIPKDKSIALVAKPSEACDICVEILGHIENI